MIVLTGSDLSDFIKKQKKPFERPQAVELAEFMKSPGNHVAIVSGLRRTGKSVILYHAMNHLNDSDLATSVLIEALESDTVEQICRELSSLKKSGFRFAFIDEASKLPDIIENTPFFHSLSISGMKTVLSGTDSLSFHFVEQDPLLGKCRVFRTTYIPFSEYSRLMDIDSIDLYIALGGVLFGPEDRAVTELLGQFPQRKTDFSLHMAIVEALAGDRYVNQSICSNIQKSLDKLRRGNLYPAIGSLRDSNELESAIKRLILRAQDGFYDAVLTDAFGAEDLREAIKNARRGNSGRPLFKRDGKLDSHAPVEDNIADLIDFSDLSEKLRHKIKILNLGEMSNIPLPSHLNELQLYLSKMGLLDYIPQYWSDGRQDARPVFTQPTLRWGLTLKLVETLWHDLEFRRWATARDRYVIYDKIIRGAQGQMLEDIVSLDMRRHLPPGWDIFKFKFTGKLSGEFDIVALEPDGSRFHLFEIKHSENANSGQRKWLKSAIHVREIEKFLNAECAKKSVVYNGAPLSAGKDSVSYLNVSCFLKSRPFLKEADSNRQLQNILAYRYPS